MVCDFDVRRRHWRVLRDDKMRWCARTVLLNWALAGVVRQVRALGGLPSLPLDNAGCEDLLQELRVALTRRGLPVDADLVAIQSFEQALDQLRDARLLTSVKFAGELRAQALRMSLAFVYITTQTTEDAHLDQHCSAES